VKENKLYYGDNLEIMRKHIADESVDLCYIDPPFNSRRNYNQIYNNIGHEDTAQAQAFEDTWTWDDAAERGLEEISGAYENKIYPLETLYLIKGLEKTLKKGSLLAYIVSMTQRIKEIHRVLKKTGSFYLHCDPTASHYLKIILDTIYCASGGEYRNEISWRRTNRHSDAARYGKVRDIIFFYTKSDKSTWNTVFQKFDEKYIAAYYNREDPDGRKWMSDNASALSLSGGGYTYEWNGVTKLWRYPIETMKRLDDEGKIYYTKNGIARRKRYLDEMNEGIPAQDDWDDIQALRRHKERLGYPTQKPEALLERIIKASSGEGDVVLDAYCGCGTTVAVAERLKRKWIGIDITFQSISLIMKRLEDTFGKKIIENVELTGVPVDHESAVALSRKSGDRTRKEFEKWAILTYSNNRAAINEKKGSDRGIDGRAAVKDSRGETKEILFSVKSGKVNSSMIRDLKGVVERESAAAGIFITLNPPTKDMIKEAKEAGIFQNDLMTVPIDRIKIVAVDEILSGAVLYVPMSVAQNVVKSAERRKTEPKNGNLFGE
jgi:site-specific DNA-methyltransferase (adenine-specific)